jgi:hypothetical protein
VNAERPGDYLVLRRHGGLFAAPGDAVREVVRAQGGVRLRLVAGAALDVDDVAGVAHGLAVHPAGAVLRAAWPEPLRGLAVYAGEPCVVIEPAAPPRTLLAREEES